MEIIGKSLDRLKAYVIVFNLAQSNHINNICELNKIDRTIRKYVTSMSLTTASFASIEASSCGVISKESPVDNLPT